MDVTIRYTSPKFRWLYPENSVGKKHIIYKGGRASTKSWAVAQAIVDHCRTYDGMRVVCGREIQNSIADSSKKLIDDTIARLGVSDEFESTNTYIRHRQTKATVKFVGLGGNVESIKSMEGVDLVWCEEAQSLSQETLDVLIPTIRKDGAKIVYTYNPDLPITPVETIPRRYPDSTIVEHINYTEVTDFLPASVIAEAEADRRDNEERYNWIWLGQYRTQSSDTFIPLGLVNEAIGRPYSRTNEGVVGGLDLAVFLDRSVLVLRQGPNVILAKEWQNMDIDDLIDEVVGVVAKYGVVKLAVDSNGQGAPIYQKLHKVLGNTVVGIMPGAASRKKKMYSKLRDEAWGAIKDWLPTGSLPASHDRDWITDLTNIKFFYDEKGRYKIESKRSYINRGFTSTDYADALGYSLLVNPGTGEYDYWGTEAERAEDRRARRRMAMAMYPSDWMGI